MIEEKIDELYGVTPNLNMNELNFIKNLIDAKEALDNKEWKTINISTLSSNDLIHIYKILIREKKIFYREQWIKLVKEELLNKIKLFKK